ncbi:MAG TPA: hypothetical protein VIJ51_15465 [Solirubrobacteraceae bacterium]
MRSAKSLISGFGVAISLVGAIACAFFITAALVAFHGSLAISSSYQPQPTVLAASAKHDPPIVIAGAPQPTVATTVAARASLPATPQVSAEVVNTHHGRTTTTIADPPVNVKVPAATPKTPTPAKPSATAPLANATAGLTNALGGVVADATGSLGNTVAAVSPALGGTLAAVGTGLANEVVAIGQTVAAVVTSLGAQPAAPQG